ncbi:alpha/beta hydrolase [Streptomyces chryseus]|uniref:Esterase n=1 Tax=Streptomyces chryseus TaxID=68186 RepID=A0ABQ3DN31_9ACTN|nr:alpha/beta fold hydrolase [Streptomyces chryseus]GGX09678.1 esterase [Streptomyces chryseus]GHB06178.1 esterase [Streptomyces chryseus]
MTAFVLVSDIFTGGWIWDEVAGRLREAGAQVCPATPTGLGDSRAPAGPDTDLETHVRDVVRLIDGVKEPQVVLVGHGYGVHPVLGAAGLRPERVSRIVFVDAGMPQDGDTAAKLVADQAVRERLLDPAGWTGGGPLSPPPLNGWQRWGSTEGVPADALERLSRLAAPQPVGTLTQPLRLAEEVSRLPMTGVLCTASGASIEGVEMLVGFGDPRLQALTDPRVTFFELGTGHWPMLSCPEELAGVLLRAAAGEGHRLTAKPGEPPAHLRPFLLDVPGQRRERVGRVDLHLPGTEEPRPAVVFVHGGPVPADARPTPRDWPALVGYAQYVASLGTVGVTVDHRLHDLADYARAAEDVADAVEAVRADPRVDGERVALWFFSGGGLLSADWLAAPPPWLRCLAATYPVLAPLPNWGLADSRFRPAEAVRTAGRLPVVVTRVGLERPEIAATVEEFLDAAGDCGAAVEVVDLPTGRHAFETTDRSEEARRAVDLAVRSVLGHLEG